MTKKPNQDNPDTDYEVCVVNKKTGKVITTIENQRDKSFSLLGVSLKIRDDEERAWKEAISPLQNFNQQQLSNLKNIINDLGPSLQRNVLSNAIQKIIDQSSDKETFAMPSHAVMFTLLAMFAGKPDKIPRKLLAKSHTEWSEEERLEAEEFLNSILKKDTIVSYRGGREETEEKYIAIVSDNPKIEAQADITATFFKEDPRFREESLAIYIKRTFGPEGLRHLLGLLIGLEENFRKGYFEWSVNDHLERLGYRRKINGAYDPELKKTSSEIIKVFTSLFITARKKEGKKEVIQGERLFSIDGFRKETFDKVIIDERIKLRATDFWFKNAFEPKDGQSGKYTKLLKKIAQENHREHHLTIYLAPLLAIFWRMNPEQKISVSGLMEWCDLDQGKYRIRDLKKLESELNYMIEQGYLGHWTSNGDNAILSNCADPFNLLLTLTPPKWLSYELQLIHERKELPKLTNQELTLINLEELKVIFKKSTLSVRQFSNKLGLTHAIVSYLLNGKRPITKDISEKITKFRDKFQEIPAK
jgi:hypothetical protein